MPGAALVTSAWELLVQTRMLQDSGKAHGAAIGVYVVICVVLVIIAVRRPLPPLSLPTPVAADVPRPLSTPS